MKATTLFRAAAVLFLLFAVGHTLGFLSLRAPTAEARAVADSMNTIVFQIDGHTYSYGRFYRGFGLSITLTQLFSAVFCWWLGGLAKQAPGEVRKIGWAFVALQVGGLVLSYLYFGPPPVVLSAVLISILAAATLRVQPAAR